MTEDFWDAASGQGLRGSGLEIYFLLFTLFIGVCDPFLVVVSPVIGAVELVEGGG